MTSPDPLLTFQTYCLEENCQVDFFFPIFFVSSLNCFLFYIKMRTCRETIMGTDKGDCGWLGGAGGAVMKGVVVLNVVRHPK